MIKLIVGLGNPGRQYEKNRHNAGFLFLDGLAEVCGQVWSNEVKFHGHVVNCIFCRDKVVLLKPQTFMNKSGLSVATVSRFYKIKTEEILVVHDELDLDVGVVKLKKGGGHAGHNGLRDIIAHLGGRDFYRIRIGVGRSLDGRSVADYVLSNPAREENEQIGGACNIVAQQISDIVSRDMALNMNEINR
ncbi:MAG: aminoacyl-tRNA hydrolase [Methylococcales bacterium]|nr:aminoacyl-tRNA hydrolase [Methylococcales bacterium]